MDPWSKVDYSRHIREASMGWMDSWRWFLLPAGCGAASPDSPDLEMAAAMVQRGDWEKNFNIRGFLRGGNI